MSAQGYAAVSPEGNILVETVSPHELAAMVNWLVVHARFNVPQGMGDFAIRENFQRQSAAHRVTIRPVTIAVKRHD